LSSIRSETRLGHWVQRLQGSQQTQAWSNREIHELPAADYQHQAKPRGDRCSSKAFRLDNFEDIG
jgi:hypothetical protein